MSSIFTQQRRGRARDPIMDDDTFSLRFGDPIKIIHDIQPSSNTTASTPIHHVPSYSPSISTKIDTGNDRDNFMTDTTHNHQRIDTKSASPLHIQASSSSSVVRDVANFAEFYHKQDGTVNEIDHD